MTAIAEKITNECLSLNDEEQLEVISRIAVKKGWQEIYETVNDLIAEKRADDLESGNVKGLTEEEVFGKYGLC